VKIAGEPVVSSPRENPYLRFGLLEGVSTALEVGGYAGVSA